MEKQQIESCIIECIQNLNLSLVEEERISILPDNVLFGSSSPLDSMGLLSLLMDLEEKLEEHDVYMTILDDHALSQKNSPFQSVLHLTDYIYEKIENGIQ